MWKAYGRGKNEAETAHNPLRYHNNDNKLGYTHEDFPSRIVGVTCYYSHRNILIHERSLISIGYLPATSFQQHSFTPYILLFGR